MILPINTKKDFEILKKQIKEKTIINEEILKNSSKILKKQLKEKDYILDLNENTKVLINDVEIGKIIWNYFQKEQIYEENKDIIPCDICKKANPKIGCYFEKNLKNINDLILNENFKDVFFEYSKSFDINSNLKEIKLKDNEKIAGKINIERYKDFFDIDKTIITKYEFKPVIKKFFEDYDITIFVEFKIPIKNNIKFKEKIKYDDCKNKNEIFIFKNLIIKTRKKYRIRIIFNQYIVNWYVGNKRYKLKMEEYNNFNISLNDFLKKFEKTC